MRVTRRTIASREAALRRSQAGRDIHETVGEIEVVTRMVVAETNQPPDPNEAYTGRRLAPMSLPRLKFLEREE